MVRKASKAEPRGAEKAVNLRSLEARLALPYLAAPTWVTVDRNRYLGYGGNRRHPGSWYAKIVLGKTPEGKEDRRQVRLGLADDLASPQIDEPVSTPAPGIGPIVEGKKPCLTYSQALAAALAWFDEESRRAPKTEPDPEVSSQPLTPYPTIGDAMDVYFNKLKTPDERSIRNTLLRIAITKGQIGSLVIANLTRMKLEEWMETIVRTPPRVRSKIGKEPSEKKGWDPNDPDNKRARMVTANRALADVKAALTYTLGQNGALSSLAWDAVKSYGNVDKSRGNAMTPTEVVHLLNSCLPEFRPLAYGTLLTAGRYGELTRLQVEDYHPRQKLIRIKAEYTKTKKERFVPLTDEAMVVFMEICRGRAPEEPLFIRANGKPWSKSQQHRPMKDSSRLVNIDTCFYGLRHTRISHWIEDGIAMAAVAESAGTSELMIRTHYKHLDPESVQKTVNSRSRVIGISQERIEQSKRELEWFAQYEVEEMPVLNFTPESLHPYNYLGKVKGGTEDPQPRQPKPTRDELAALLAQDVSVLQIAKAVGYSNVMVTRWCKAFGLEVPGRGYHAKQRAKKM